MSLTVTKFSSYRHNIAGGDEVLAFIGKRVALVIDTKGCSDLCTLCSSNEAATAHFVDNLERLLGLFDEVVGYTPPIPEALPNGLMRVRVEAAFIPAAGLAHHGRAGIAVGPAFVEGSVKSFVSYLSSGSPPNLHHVFTYEFCRNYVDPDRFTTTLDFHLQNEPPSCWGFVNQGFINILGCLLMQEKARFSPSSITFDYFGQDAARFMDSMERELITYQAGLADGTVSFKSAFHSERFPWAKERSVDNLWSGLLVRLWKDHGKTKFLKGFFKATYSLLAPMGRKLAHKDEWKKALGNFALAACFGARADVSSFFVHGLKWQVDHHEGGGGGGGGGFESALDSILAAAVADAVEEEEIASAVAAAGSAGSGSAGIGTSV